MTRALARELRAQLADPHALCEALGLPVHVVQGSERALKVTAEADFGRAEALEALPE